jgi:phosphatidylserine synthase
MSEMKQRTGTTKSEPLDLPPNVEKIDVQQFLNNPKIRQSIQPPKASPTLFDSALLTVPFALLYAALDALTFVQFNEDIDWPDVYSTGLSGALALFGIVAVTNRYKDALWMQMVMMVAACITSCYMVHLLKEQNVFYQVRNCSHMAALWIYLTVQLELVFACLVLLVVSMYSFFFLR